MRKKVSKRLHQAHIGIYRTKWRVRATIFWPQINQQIEEIYSQDMQYQTSQLGRIAYLEI